MVLHGKADELLAYLEDHGHEVRDTTSGGRRNWMRSVIKRAASGPKRKRRFAPKEVNPLMGLYRVTPVPASPRPETKEQAEIRRANVRRYIREWKVMTGRIKPEPKTVITMTPERRDLPTDIGSKVPAGTLPKRDYNPDDPKARPSYPIVSGIAWIDHLSRWEVIAKFRGKTHRAGFFSRDQFIEAVEAKNRKYDQLHGPGNHYQVDVEMIREAVARADKGENMMFQVRAPLSGAKPKASTRPPVPHVVGVNWDNTSESWAVRHYARGQIYYGGQFRKDDYLEACQRINELRLTNAAPNEDVKLVDLERLAIEMRAQDSQQGVQSPRCEAIAGPDVESITPASAIAQ